MKRVGLRRSRVFRALERLLADALCQWLLDFVNGPQPGTPAWSDARGRALARNGIVSASAPSDASDLQVKAGLWRLSRGWLNDILAGRSRFAGEHYRAPLALQFARDGRAVWAVSGATMNDWEDRVKFAVALFCLPWPRAMLRRCAQCEKYLLRSRRGRAFCSVKCKDSFKVAHRNKAEHAENEHKRRIKQARKRHGVVAKPKR